VFNLSGSRCHFVFSYLDLLFINSSIVLLKEMLKASKVLNTEFVCMVADFPFGLHNSCDNVVQGLVGRCCGVFKEEHNVRIVANKEAVAEYRDWLKDGTIPKYASSKSSGGGCNY
jgi:hypothetical protein